MKNVYFVDWLWDDDVLRFNLTSMKLCWYLLSSFDANTFAYLVFHI